MQIEIAKYTDGGFRGYVIHISPPQNRIEMEHEDFYEFDAATARKALKLCEKFIKARFGAAWSITLEGKTAL